MARKSRLRSFGIGWMGIIALMVAVMQSGFHSTAPTHNGPPHGSTQLQATDDAILHQTGVDGLSLTKIVKGSGTSLADPAVHPTHATHPLSSRGAANPLNGWMTFQATWYSPQDGPGQGTVTATGSHVKDGWTIAVDPHVIPLGSLVEICFANGIVHTYRAEDTGGAIRGKHIDIFNSSRIACLHNGVQKVMVRILRKGS